MRVRREGGNSSLQKPQIEKQQQHIDVMDVCVYKTHTKYLSKSSGVNNTATILRQEGIESPFPIKQLTRLWDVVDICM